MTTPGNVMTPDEVLALADKQQGRGPSVTEGPAAAPITMPGEQPPPSGYKAVDPLADPAKAQALADEAMGKGPAAPIIAPRPPVDEIELPGGWYDRDGHLQKKIRIRELNGADEEELAKPYQRTSAAFIDTVVKRCVVSLGGVKPEPRQLDQLLIGDRDAIVIGVRVLTYGPKIDVPVRCPNCRHDFTIELDLEKEIETKNLPGDNRKRTREMTLPRGEIVEINLMDGSAQMAAYNTADELNDQERISIMLKECVYSINGDLVTSVEQIRKLGAGARRALIEFLQDNTCGPQWTAVMQECPNCQDSNPLPLNLVALFL